MERSIEALNTLLDVLRIEQEEDKRHYTDNVLNRSIQERRMLGVTWYPIVIKESYYGFGERLILEIERPTGKEIPHQFQYGRVASLFSNNSDGEMPSISGIVTSSRTDTLRLTLFVDELPDWVDKGKLGLDLLFDETSYREMENALKVVIKSKNNRTAELRDVFYGEKEAHFKKLSHQISIPGLNESQNRALNNVLEAVDVAAVHGPPGTGKTTTLMECILQVLKNEKQVLVVAPSNTAVDLLTEKLAERNIEVIRFGNPARVSETLLQHTLDFKISAHPDYKRVKDLRKSAVEYKNMGMKYKRNFGKEEREQRKRILDESRKINQEASALEDYIVGDLIEKARVFTATPVGCTGQFLKDKHFKTLFIDEAGQALEPSCWIPILKADRVIFAGDHLQLPPTVKSQEAMKKGLAVTLFEKIMANQQVDVMLETQYRMNEKIMKFSGDQFYKGKLKADDKVKFHILNDSLPENFQAPVEFIDTAGCGYEEKQEKETLSTFNPDEANLVLTHINILSKELELTGRTLDDYSCGIISPYKAQVNYLKVLFEENGLITPEKRKISINTVDGFQGQERDIIYISLVRSNDRQEIGFLSDIRRMNVALTRAKKKLVVIGDSATFGNNSFYKNFLSYIEEIQAYKSAWEIIYSG